MGSRAHNIKTGLHALGNVENRYVGQDMKTGPSAIDITKNESRSAYYENWIWRHLYRRKRVKKRKTWNLDPTAFLPTKTSLGAQDMKMGSNAFGIVKNESGGAKHENMIWHPRYRWKRLWECKTWKLYPMPSVPMKMSAGV
jgi:hypothetical protein